jgi:hypothetical protein
LEAEMEKPTSDEHFEESFEFPLWKLIKQRAEEKDISYLAAMNEVSPEYAQSIRYGDREFEDAAIEKRWKELSQLAGTEDSIVLAVKKKGA